MAVERQALSQIGAGGAADWAVAVLATTASSASGAAIGSNRNLPTEISIGRVVTGKKNQTVF